MRRQRHHVLGVGLLEADAGAGQAVDPGGLDVTVAVAAERVGPESVDRDQEDVQARLSPQRAGKARPRGEGGQADEAHGQRDREDRDGGPAPRSSGERHRGDRRLLLLLRVLDSTQGALRPRLNLNRAGGC